MLVGVLILVSHLRKALLEVDDKSVCILKCVIFEMLFKPGKAIVASWMRKGFEPRSATFMPCL